MVWLTCRALFTGRYSAFLVTALHVAQFNHAFLFRYEAALQSFVLLKNGPPPSSSLPPSLAPSNLLPLKVGTRIAVLGPQAIAREGLLEDYAADQQVKRLVRLRRRKLVIFR